MSEIAEKNKAKAMEMIAENKGLLDRIEELMAKGYSPVAALNAAVNESDE